MSSTAAIESAFTPETRVVWIETPTNPALGIVDIAAVAAIAHERGALRRGRQHVRHAVPAAAARARRRRRGALDHEVPRRSLRRDRGVRRGGRRRSSASTSRSCRTRSGAVPSPFDCYLVLRGVKTLAVRMDRHCSSAMAVAADARRPPRGRRRSLPGPRVAPRPRGRGAARCAASAGWSASSRRAARRPRSRSRPGPSSSRWPSRSGAVESLIEHPARMTHASAVGSPLEVDPALVRLSVGLESVDDLLADLDAPAPWRGDLGATAMTVLVVPRSSGARPLGAPRRGAAPEPRRDPPRRSTTSGSGLVPTILIKTRRCRPGCRGCRRSPGRTPARTEPRSGRRRGHARRATRWWSASSGAQQPTLLAFLSSGCITCRDFWETFADPRLDAPGRRAARRGHDGPGRRERVGDHRACAGARARRDVVAGVGRLRRARFAVLRVRRRCRRGDRGGGHRAGLGAGGVAHDEAGDDGALAASTTAPRLARGVRPDVGSMTVSAKRAPTRRC